jgi:hypothetical protein
MKNCLMKIPTKFCACAGFYCGLALLGLLGVSGCALMTSHPPNDTAAMSARRAAAEVQDEQRALDLAMTTLTDLVNQPGADLRIPYHQFSIALDRLVTAANRTDLTGKTMAQKNAAYLRTWDKQLEGVTFDKVREVSANRRTEVSNRFDSINQRYADSQTAVQPVIAYLLDIRRALSADLTEGGLTAIKPIAENAHTNAAKLQTALAALTDQLADSGSRLSSIALQNNAPPPGPARAEARAQ